jgi:hypothetical protein
MRLRFFNRPSCTGQAVVIRKTEAVLSIILLESQLFLVRFLLESFHFESWTVKVVTYLTVQQVEFQYDKLTF